MNKVVKYTSTRPSMLFDESLLQARIQDAIMEHGTQAKWAIHLGLSKAFVCKVVLGKKKPGPRILKDLGLVQTTTEVSGCGD